LPSLIFNIVSIANKKKKTLISQGLHPEKKPDGSGLILRVLSTQKKNSDEN
jgi:hypothetical protein